MAASPRPERRYNVPLIIAGAVVALGGFGASVLVSRASEPPVQAAATSAVVVAARDLESRKTIADGDLTTARYATSNVPPNALTEVKVAKGQVLQVTLKKGQPVLGNMLARSSASAGAQSAFLPLPAGYVAATLPTGELIGVAGNIRAGDYIDVIAVVAPRAAAPSSVRTIYSGVHVISVGIAPDPATGSQSSSSTAGSLTVAVTQCQAEFLNWFLANAALKYTLLSSSDYPTAAASTPDPGCPASGSKGVTQADISSRWPGLVG
jgi:Flp pilus assembly protein CpaB